MQVSGPSHGNAWTQHQNLTVWSFTDLGAFIQADTGIRNCRRRLVWALIRYEEVTAIPEATGAVTKNPAHPSRRPDTEGGTAWMKLGAGPVENLLPGEFAPTCRTGKQDGAGTVDRKSTGKVLEDLVRLPAALIFAKDIEVGKVPRIARWLRYRGQHRSRTCCYETGDASCKDPLNLSMLVPLQAACS